HRLSRAVRVQRPGGDRGLLAADAGACPGAGAGALREARRVRLAHRLAVLTAAATGVLIVFGGLVTNTGAALAVPDWPTTFGHNMFLFPLSGMVGGVFYEHSHRLLGALVGLLTLALAATLWRAGGRAVAAPAARVALVLLALQLVLGAGSYLARFSAIWIPGGQLTMLALPVAHRLAGGLLLASAVVMAVRVLATARPAAALGVA